MNYWYQNDCTDNSLIITHNINVVKCHWNEHNTKGYGEKNMKKKQYIPGWDVGKKNN